MTARSTSPVDVYTAPPEYQRPDEPERFFVDFTFGEQTVSVWLDDAPLCQAELLEQLASVVAAVGRGALVMTVEGDGRREPCPECREGEVEFVGRQCRETGHTPYACDRGCGYGG